MLIFFNKNYLNTHVFIKKYLNTHVCNFLEQRKGLYTYMLIFINQVKLHQWTFLIKKIKITNCIKIEIEFATFHILRKNHTITLNIHIINYATITL